MSTRQHPPLWHPNPPTPRRAERQLMSYEREGWVDDEPARLTGRLEVRPAAELGPIIVCLDTSGALGRLCGGAVALRLQRLPRRGVPLPGCSGAGAAGGLTCVCAVAAPGRLVRSPHPTALLPGPHPLTPSALPLFQISLAPPPSRLPRRLHVRPARGGGQGGGPGVHARRAPPAASLLPLRVQVGAGAAAWLAAGCRPSTTCTLFDHVLNVWSNVYHAFWPALDALSCSFLLFPRAAARAR